MAELFQRVRTQISTLFQSMDKRMRMGLAAGGLFVVVVVVVILFLSRSQYVPLATGLEFDQMSKITTMLTEKGISYKEEPNVIYVDVDDLVKAKMGMAVDTGISTPDYGWTDVFANTSLTMTSSVREAQFNIATANALATGLEIIDGVASAKVSLFIAPESSFALSTPSQSRASVILTLDDGFQFSQEQVNGIVNIILNTVENLEKDSISIIDQTGIPLNGFSSETEAFLASSNYDQKLKVESTINSKMIDLLGVVYGRNNIQIISSVSLDFDDETTSSTAYAPPVEGEVDGMIRSINEIKESVSSGSTAEGVPGTDSVTDTTEYPTGGDTGSSVESTSKLVNYELNEVNKVITKAKGEITDIQVAVIVNSKVLPDNILTDDHKQDLVDLVTTAAGIETRSVKVSAMEFTDNEYGGELYDSDLDQVAPGIPLWLVGLIVGIIALVVIAFFIFTKSKTNKERKDEITKIQAEEEQKRQDELEEIRTDVEDKSSPKYQIEKFIDANPEAVASLLRSWMSET